MLLHAQINVTQRCERVYTWMDDRRGVPARPVRTVAAHSLSSPRGARRSNLDGVDWQRAGFVVVCCVDHSPSVSFNVFKVSTKGKQTVPLERRTMRPRAVRKVNAMMDCGWWIQVLIGGHSILHMLHLKTYLNTRINTNKWNPVVVITPGIFLLA